MLTDNEVMEIVKGVLASVGVVCNNKGEVNVGIEVLDMTLRDIKSNDVIAIHSAKGKIDITRRIDFAK